jgi:hypothetical protein
MPRFPRWLPSVYLTLLLCPPMMQAAPPLTTIQDVLYKADGTRFSGVAFVEWRSFQASDFSNIATQSVTVPIVNGSLRVQLVPTTTGTPGASYTVKYNSDGRIQFVETWSVPPSNVPLKLKDVRVVGPSSTVVTQSTATIVQITDVVGLQNELNSRPVKGTGFAGNRALLANANGEIEAVPGNLSDCVRVDGTAGACGVGSGTGAGFIDGEEPAGLINGSNLTFTLGQIPAPSSSVQLFRNGILQKQGADYTVSGNTITFANPSVPQTGDLVQATYRLADAGNPPGVAGGHLTGNYPNPQIALGVVSNSNIAAAAGIVESKLTLNFPTHSSANDPTASEKLALAGTSGTPSTTNRFVTDQDSRMTNARTPSAHAMLGTSHSDSTTGTVARGDLIVGQGASPTTWSRLPLGPANRCLMSNGFDAVWNTCLYTGFTSGSIPFVDAVGNLSQNSARLTWDNSNRRLSVGHSLSLATMYLYDSTPALGSTTLVVRAGQAQSTSALQQWMDATGVELAKVASDGALSSASFAGASSASRAAWRDSGTASDPSIRVDGDGWYNTTGLSRKTQEGGQVHTSPTVLCSSTGVSTSSTALTRVGSCTLPANLLKAGDRVDIQFSYSHEGSATGFNFEIRWGGTALASRSGAAGESRIAGKASAGVHSTGAQWDSQSWGTSLTLVASVGNAADSLASQLVIDFLGQMASSTADTVTLRNFTVTRYPAQANP